MLTPQSEARLSCQLERPKKTAVRATFHERYQRLRHFVVAISRRFGWLPLSPTSAHGCTARPPDGYDEPLPGAARRLTRSGRHDVIDISVCAASRGARRYRGQTKLLICGEVGTTTAAAVFVIVALG
jgi:hypothetical protein